MRCPVCNTKLPKQKLRCDSCLAWVVGTELDDDDMPIELEPDGTILASEVKTSGIVRIQTGPWDIIFGSHIDAHGKTQIGLGDQSVTLLGGSPGDGKSTFCLQVIGNVARALNRESLYFGVEQSKEEYVEFMKRVTGDQLTRIRMLPLGSQGSIAEIIAVRKPGIVVVDSLTSLTEDANEQVEFAKVMKRLSTRYHCPAIIVSQVTKTEDFAGLNKLKHEVDTLLMFNKFDHQGEEIREIIPEKNRLGRTNVRFYMTMTDKGLVGIEEPEEDDDE